MDGASLRDLGRQVGDGSPIDLVRRSYPPGLLAIVVALPSRRRVYLSESVGPADVARVLRHLTIVHLPERGVAVCRPPACGMAVVLRADDDVDRRPAIASSA